MKHLAILVLSAVGMVVAAAAGWAEVPLTPTFPLLGAEQAAGRHIYNEHCASCHAQRRGAREIYGPSLAGVVGRKAASVPGFPYSEALKKSGLVWTEDNLRKWVADPAHTVPNTLMPHVAISDPAEQLYLIAYLKTLKGPTAR